MGFWLNKLLKTTQKVILENMKKSIIAKHCWPTSVNASWKGSDGLKMNLMKRSNGVRQISYNSARTKANFYMLVGITGCANRVESDLKDLWTTMCHQTNANHFIPLRKKLMSYGDVWKRSAICKMCEIILLLHLLLKASVWILRSDLGTALHERCGTAKSKKVAGSLVSTVWGNQGWKERGLDKWE